MIVFGVAGVAVAVVSFGDNESKSVNYEDVESLIFGSNPGTFSTRPADTYVPFVRVSTGAVGYVVDAEQALGYLIEKLGESTALKFEETPLLNEGVNAIGLFYPRYQTSDAFEKWLEVWGGFAEKILQRRDAESLEVFLPAIEAEILAANHADERHPQASPSAGELEKVLPKHNSCEFAWIYNVIAYNKAVAAYASLATGSDEQDMVGCLIRPFLYVAGLKNIDDFPNAALVVKVDGRYEFSDLVKCALNVVYSPLLDPPGSGANTAISRTIGAFLTERDCQ